LAIEYGVLARDRFLKRLGELRQLGTFKELLEPGGAILYRNLFRDDQVDQAWKVMTLLRPWHERITCYLGGEQAPVKEVHDVLWCAAFLAKDRPCRAPEGKRGRPAGCLGARVLLGPGQWALEEEEQRHALTFAEVDGDGLLRFDREALASFAARGRSARCPASPARNPQAFAEAFADVPARSLGWPLVAEMEPALRKQLAKVLEKELAFVLEDDHEELEPHAPLELLEVKGKQVIRLAGGRGGSIASELKLPAAMARALAAGHVLRAVRMQEAYARRKGGHYVVEQRYVLSTRVHLLPTDRAEAFAGYKLATYPRSTTEYAAWVDRIQEALP
jgi:hypothetical protein